MVKCWRSFFCKKRELCLDVVLPSGQSFRWREYGNGEWRGVMADRVWCLKQDESNIYFQVHRDVVHMERTKHCDDARESEPHCGSLVKPCFTHSEHRCKTRASRCKSQQFCNVGKTYLDGSPDVQCTLQRSTGLEEQNVLNEPVVVGAAACNPLAIAHSTRGILLPGLNDESISSMQILTSPREEESGYEDNLRILKDYFQMSVDTDSLYKQWNMVDSYFKSAAKDLRGVRILRQDPVENLFSFICSSNNNISRISSMVENLCSHYGRPVAHVDGKLYCSFPSVGALAQEGVEDHLRQLGFGYRAKYVSHCAQFIMEHHEPNWFQYLRDLPYSDARSQLMKLCGVGPKVADCVCLMSLDKPEAMPVDTHVLQFTALHYMPPLKSANSLSDSLYNKIGDFFRDLWGNYAGWAQAVLFIAELQKVKGSRSKSPKQLCCNVSSKKRKKRHASERC